LSEENGIKYLGWREILQDEKGEYILHEDEKLYVDTWIPSTTPSRFDYDLVLSPESRYSMRYAMNDTGVKFFICAW